MTLCSCLSVWHIYSVFSTVTATKCSNQSTLSTMHSATCRRRHQYVRPPPKYPRSRVSQLCRHTRADRLTSPHSVLITFPPPMLHLLLSITMCLFDFLNNVSRIAADQYLQSIDIIRTWYHRVDGISFKGQHCKVICSNSKNLLSLACIITAPRRVRHKLS